MIIFVLIKKKMGKTTLEKYKQRRGGPEIPGISSDLLSCGRKENLHFGLKPCPLSISQALS